MDNKDNVLEFRSKPPTDQECEAWAKFVQWTKTATPADWEALYGEQASELRSRFYELFYAFVEAAKRKASGAKPTPE
jgi:hypothetical protein